MYQLSTTLFMRKFLHRVENEYDKGPPITKVSRRKANVLSILGKALAVRKVSVS